jgi:hypothetical protein
MKALLLLAGGQADTPERDADLKRNDEHFTDWFGVHCSCKPVALAVHEMV